MARIELPHIINKRMDHDSLVQAIQKNFDALTGEVTAVEAAIVTAAGAVAEQVVETAIQTEGMGTEELRRLLAEAGVGAEDGAPPSSAPTGLRAQGGIGNWFIVIWDGVANTSPVTYKVYVDTLTVTGAANQYVGSFTVPGGTTKSGTFVVRDFPTGHRLAGQGVATGTTYRVAVRAADANGDGPLSAEVTTSPLKVDASTVLSAGTIVGDLIAAATIAGDKIIGRSITGEKISGGTIDAITITTGTLNGGTINGVSFYGGAFQSSTGANYVSMSSAIGGAIDFFTSSARVGRITGGINAVGLEGSNLVDVISISNNQAEVMAAATLKLSGTISGTFKHVGADLGFFSKAPVAKQADPGNHTNTGGPADDGPARTKINEILGVLRAYGLI